MKTFIINTLGCKVNQYEGQQVRQLLENHGLEAARSPDKADLIVVNSCCVTHTASAKSRQYVRKARKHHPNATIILAGCLPAGQPDELSNIKPSVHIVSQKKDLAKTLYHLLGGSHTDSSGLPIGNFNSFSTSKRALSLDRPESPKASNEKKLFNIKQPEQNAEFGFGTLKSYKGKCRAFLKIQDGCDGYCAYCIVPKIRNRLYNKPASVVLQEAYNLIYAGHKEIVLTGIFLGAYGQCTVRRGLWEPGKKDMLADLVEKVAQVSGLKRLRLSSLEPADVTDKLLDVFSKYRNIMPHLHLPLQSGSEPILKKMRRQYTASEFLQVADRVRLTLDRPAITTDIIVGFPGERDEDFEQTVEVAKAVEFAKMHVFSFSPRSGTAAAKMQPRIETGVIKKRSAILRQLDKELQAKFRAQFAGETVGVIVEETRPVRGRSDRYFMVELDAKDSAKRGEYVQAVNI
jgi:threonylcarbamoyladenosine tRNA methylthiotransferase MtaB